MDRFTRNTLHLNPRTDEELQSVVQSFEQKWRAKARRFSDERASQ